MAEHIDKEKILQKIERINTEGEDDSSSCRMDRVIDVGRLYDLSSRSSD